MNLWPLVEAHLPDENGDLAQGGRPRIAHLDATFIRSRGGGEDLVGLTRHGKGSKIQALVDEDSRPIAFQLASANPTESTITRDLIEKLDDLPEVVVADRAYDSDPLRDIFAWLAAWRQLANRWERRAEHYRQWLYLGFSLIYVRRGLWP